MRGFSVGILLTFRKVKVGKFDSPASRPGLAFGSGQAEGSGLTPSGLLAARQVLLYSAFKDKALAPPNGSI